MSEKEIAIVPSPQVTEDDIRKFIVGNKTFAAVPKAQIDIAIETARAYNLNPFKREVHFTPYNGELKIIVGYEVYLKRAEATGKLDGWKVDIQGQGLEMKAVVVIHRKDWSHPFTHEAYKSEVAQNTPIWGKMPRFMLKKVAIGQAFRLAFPEQIGGLPYTEDEISYTGNTTNSAPASIAEGLIEEDDGISQQPQDAIEDITPICDTCGKILTPKVAEYSKDKFGKYLCTTHQKSPAPTTLNEDIDATLPATEEQKEQLRMLVKEGKIPKEREGKIDGISYANAAKVLERAKAQAEGVTE